MVKGVCEETADFLKKPITSFKASKEGSADLKANMKLACKKQLLHEGRKLKASPSHRFSRPTTPANVVSALTQVA